MTGRVSNALDGAVVSVPASAVAAQVIEGEAYAKAWLDRLHAEMAQPGELAALLALLTGEMLHGACRAIEKVLEGRRNA